MTNWMNHQIPMKSSRFWEDPTSMYHALILDKDNKEEEEFEQKMDCDCFDNMMDAKYEKVNPSDVAKAQTHLSPSQQVDLA